ncbi:phenylalanyl-tRNA synthetase beta chain, partial [Striga asiatica]
MGATAAVTPATTNDCNSSEQGPPLPVGKKSEGPIAAPTSRRCVAAAERTETGSRGLLGCVSALAGNGFDLAAGVSSSPLEALVLLEIANWSHTQYAGERLTNRGR